jgi:hypothetical protein
VQDDGRLILSSEIEGRLGHRVQKEGTSCQVQWVVGQNNLRRHSSAQLGLNELVELFLCFLFLLYLTWEALECFRGKNNFTFKNPSHSTKPKLGSLIQSQVTTI